MIRKVFSVYDSKVEAFLQPFFMHTKGEAIRGFTEIVNDPNHQFSKYPADYTLFELGNYDDSNGSIVTFPTPVSLGLALEFVRS